MSYDATHKPSSPNKGAQRRIRLLLILLMSLIVWALITFWDQSGKMEKESLKLDVLNLKLTEVRKLNEDTKRQIVRLNDSEAKEERARKELHYAKPGETVFDIPK